MPTGLVTQLHPNALTTDVVGNGCLASGAELGWTRLIRLTAEAG
jgi:hypothetical protein